MNKYEFYVNNVEYVDKSEDIDVDFVPALHRRRLTLLNRASFHTLEKCYSDKVKNIVYSSENGEFDRLLKMSEQLKSENEVSPAIFSSAVHNGVLGLYSILKQYKNPYNAISSCENSLSAGLLSAVSGLGKGETLFCYSDMVGKSPLSLCVNLSLTPSVTAEKWFISLKDSDVCSFEPDIMLPFLKGEVARAEFYNYTLERV